MTYINSILEPGEKVRYHTTVSWTAYTAAILLAICALASLLAGARYAEMVTISWFAAIVFAVSAIVAFLPAWFRRWRRKSPSPIAASYSSAAWYAGIQSK